MADLEYLEVGEEAESSGAWSNSVSARVGARQKSFA
jgi:hypothetical protein